MVSEGTYRVTIRGATAYPLQWELRDSFGVIHFGFDMDRLIEILKEIDKSFRQP